jgi:hypothetical protein
MIIGSMVQEEEMGQLVELREILRAKRRETERHSLEKCIEILESSLALSVRAYLSSPRDERLVRAKRLEKLAELLVYAHQIS